MQDIARWIWEAQRHVILAISAQLLIVKRIKIIQLHYFSKLN